jgi:hypothetical protein
MPGHGLLPVTCRRHCPNDPADPAFRRAFARAGGTEEWRKVLKEATDEDLNARDGRLFSAANGLAGGGKQGAQDRLG